MPNIHRVTHVGINKMKKGRSNIVRFRGREEEVLDVFSVCGRHYSVLERLSRNGAFRVFDARACPGGDYRVLYRFPFSKVTRQKIETLRRIGGPTANRNFPRIFDCARQGADLIVVLEWVWGTNLRDLLRDVRAGKAPRPKAPELVRLFRGLAHGLSHYHRRANLVHGDVSPANIILTSGTKQLVLIDFGSAWPVEQSATRRLGDGVTLPYAAPERLAHHAVEDFRADIFSLAVVAYELLTLAIPFDGAGGRAGLPDLMTKIADCYVPPSKLIPKPDRLTVRALEKMDELFRTGLTLHPDGRFSTRSEWLEAWDGIDMELRKGERLSSLEAFCLAWVERVAGALGYGKV